MSAGEDLHSWVPDPAEDARVPDWAEGWEDIWEPGEDGAHNALKAFLDAPVAHSEGRDLPARRYTSRLSPHPNSGRSLHDRSGPQPNSESYPPPSGPARLISSSPKSVGESFVTN